MALLFVATAAIGFTPNSVAILSGEKANPALIVHIHATEFDRSGSTTDDKRGNEMIHEIEYQGMMLADKIIEVAKQTGAEAIHPGYGFLSENPQFAEICESCKIKFIGPSASVIETMGDKNQARDTAKRFGVPVTPGSEGVVPVGPWGGGRSDSTGDPGN